MRLPYICPEMENNKIREFVIKDRTNILGIKIWENDRELDKVTYEFQFFIKM